MNDKIAVFTGITMLWLAMGYKKKEVWYEEKKYFETDAGSYDGGYLSACGDDSGDIYDCL